MIHEKKAKAEIEAMALEHLQRQLNGDQVFGLKIYSPKKAGSDPSVAIGWIEAPVDMGPAFDAATTTATRLWHRYEVTE